MLAASRVLAFEVLPVKLFSRSVVASLSSLCLLLVSACGPGAGEPSGTSTSASAAGGATATNGSGGDGGASASVGTGGAGGASVGDLDTILAELRADTNGALTKHAGESGWPVAVIGGHLFVSTDMTLASSRAITTAGRAPR